MLLVKRFFVDLRTVHNLLLKQRSYFHCFLYSNSHQRGLNQKAYNKIKALRSVTSGWSFQGWTWTLSSAGLRKQNGSKDTSERQVVSPHCIFYLISKKKKKKTHLGIPRLIVNFSLWRECKISVNQTGSVPLAQCQMLHRLALVDRKEQNKVSVLNALSFQRKPMCWMVPMRSSTAPRNPRSFCTDINY